MAFIFGVLTGVGLTLTVLGGWLCYMLGKVGDGL